MKFFAVAALLAAFNVYAQEANIALEDNFKVAPDLQKPNNSDYQEKPVNDGKLFHKHSENELKITKGKESSDKLEIYQLKMEKLNGKLEKFEQIVEVDKTDSNKVKSILKCGGHSKGGCQAYTPGFCKKLLQEDKLNEKITKDGEAKTLEFYKELYKEKEAFEPKSEMLSKLSALNEKAINDSGIQPNNKEIKDNLKPVYPSPLVLFKKEKIQGDIAECRKFGGIWVKPKEQNSQPNSQPNNAITKGATSAQ